MLDALQRFCLSCRSFHAFEHIRAGVLERDIEIGQNLALHHQRDDLVDIRIRIGIDIMQPHSGTEFAKRAGKIDEFRPRLAPLPVARRVFDVDTISRGVLRNDQELLYPGRHQALCFAQHVAGRAGDQVAAQFGNNAERATIVATL